MERRNNIIQFISDVDKFTILASDNETRTIGSDLIEIFSSQKEGRSIADEIRQLGIEIDTIDENNVFRKNGCRIPVIKQFGVSVYAHYVVNTNPDTTTISMYLSSKKICDIIFGAK